MKALQVNQHALTDAWLQGDSHHKPLTAKTLEGIVSRKRLSKGGARGSHLKIII